VVGGLDRRGEEVLSGLDRRGEVEASRTSETSDGFDRWGEEVLSGFDRWSEVEESRTGETSDATRLIFLEGGRGDASTNELDAARFNLAGPVAPPGLRSAE